MGRGPTGHSSERKTAVSELANIAQAMVASGKGILAADESAPTIKKRFDSIQAESTEENRLSYREMLFTTEGAEEFISGVILFDETIRQKTSNGATVPELLTSKGILPGIKVDKGAKGLPLAHGEKLTEGLDGLRDRLIEYQGIGARVAKPEHPVVCIAGDGGLQFTLGEMGAAIEVGGPIIVICWNNNGYGEIKSSMLRSGVAPIGVDLHTPDFVEIAKAYGLRAEALALASRWPQIAKKANPIPSNPRPSRTNHPLSGRHRTSRLPRTDRPSAPSVGAKDPR